ncbi:MAG: molybdate ABC transporter substrate-binding protein [Solirubrobacterales bacterium 70-9]|nr:MAG: molybdate ABC transporter substrate-binding protein [Solirubrobacterales bacterium 70-9]
MALALCLAAPAAASAITVYAAASLREAFPEMAPAQTYNFSGSNELALQIERGAPADVFASAAPEEAQELFQKGLCSRPVTFATNVVVMLVPNGNPGHLKSVYSLRQGGHTIAVGIPGVPIGGYTRELLARMRLSSILTNNTVTLEKNVTGITAKVALGAVEAGFAYVTDGRIVSDRVEIIRLPRWAQPPVRYQACIVHRAGADTAGAQKFMEVLTGKRGRTALKKGGFGLPPKA